MRLTRLRLFQYRNIVELEMFPPAGISLFAGRNGQGKTNLLEAIYFLGYARSFRTATSKECIRHGQTECRVEGSVQHGTLTRDIGVSISQSEKRLFVLGKPASLEEFVGNLHLLAFTHQHLGVVRGGPAERRAFLDRAMVTLYPGHVACLAAYARALKQRNSLLASARDGRASLDDALLESWDEALIRHGSRIVWNRSLYVEEIKRELPQGMFDGEILRMHYASSVGDDASDLKLLEENFSRRLRKAREGDRRNGHTSVGPHRDDLKLYINGKSLPDFGSAGQQRSGLLALYFAQMEIHRRFHGFYPVFLVDDAEAELDAERLKTFLEYLSSRTQTFLTSAKGFLLTAMIDCAALFEIREGTVRPLENET